MPYNPQNYRRIRAEYETKYLRAREDAERRRREIELLIPQVRDIHRALSGVGLEIMRASLEHGDSAAREEAIASLRQKNEDLLHRRGELLCAAGFPADYTELRYECPACSDTGFLDNSSMCECMRRRLRLAGYETSGLGNLLREQTFDNYSLDYFKNDERAYRTMSAVLHMLRDWAQHFSSQSDNLLLLGGILLLLGLVGLIAICGLLLTTLLRLSHINLILGDALALGVTTTRLELRYIDSTDHIRTRQLRRLRSEDIITTLGQTLIVGLVLNIIVCRFLLYLRSDRSRSHCGFLNLRLLGLRLCFGSLLRLCLGSRGGSGLLRLLLAVQINRTQNFRAHCLHLVLNRDTLTLDYNLLFEVVITLLLADRHCRRFLRDTLTHLTARIAASVRSELLLKQSIHLRIDQRVRRIFDLDALLLEKFGYAAYSNFELSRNLIESQFTFV